VLLLPAWRIGLDIADVGAVSTSHVFYMKSPKIEARADFVQSNLPEFNYSPPDSRDGGSLLAMERNEGYVYCDLVPNNAKPQGAIAKELPGYKGEVYILDGPGSAKVVGWTTNSAVIEYAGVKPGSTLVYNMNWDPGWSANGQPAPEVLHAVGATLPEASGRVELRYRPRSMGSALLVFLATVLAIGFGPRLPSAFGRLRRRLYRRGQLG
jgi:hypothetical protein